MKTPSETPTVRIRTLGGLALDDGDFSRPVPLLILAYLAIERRLQRKSLERAFFPDAADPGDSLSTVLRLLENALGTADDDVITRTGDELTTAARCDAVDLEAAYDRSDHEAVVELYRGPFLDGLEAMPYVRPEAWSDDLRAWIQDRRLRVAARVVTSAVRLARARRLAGRRDDARPLTHLAFKVFRDAHVDDTVRPGTPRFDAATLQLLHGLLCADRSVHLAAFREAAAGYPALASIGGCDEAEVLLDTSRTNLTHTDAPFIGREEERRAAMRILASSSSEFLTITGAGGVGKSSLANRIAFDALASGRYPDGVHFVELEATRFANLVPVQIAETVGVELRADGDALDQLVARLANARVCLILDNFEHLIGRADVPERLARACAGSGMVVTSRERLDQPSEHVLALDGLPVPDADLPPAELAANEAVALFLQTARLRLPDLDLDERTAPRIAEVCRLADGHPLVIELAARLVDVLPLEDLAAHFEHDLAVLDADAPDVPSRQRSLRAVWDYSWRLLSQAERDVLSGLAVFRGGFDWRAAKAVTGAGPDLLRRLVDKSLLQATPDRRFRFHVALRAFADERLRPPERRAALEERHRTHYLEQARVHARRARSHDAQRGMAFFGAEASNLRAVWERSDDVDTLLELLDLLELHQLRQGRWADRLELLEATLARAEAAGRNDSIASLHNRAAAVHLQTGDVQRAERSLRAALAAQEAPARDAVRAETLSQLGGVHYQRREYDDAIACFAEAGAIQRALGNDAEAVSEAANVGAVHYQRADYDAAIRTWREALTAERRAQNRDGQALLLNNLGAAYRIVGKLEDALLHFEKALTLRDRLGDAVGSSVTRANIGSVHFLRGDYDRSLEIHEQLLREHRERRDPAGRDPAAEALVLNNLAMIHERQGRLDRAEALLADALRIQEDIDERIARTATLYNLSTVALQRGDAPRAEALAAQALELADETGDVAARSYALTFHGAARAALGDADAARARLDEALARFASLGDVDGTATVRLEQARVALAGGDAASAIGHAEEAYRLADAHGLVPQAWRARRLAARALAERGRHDEAARAARDALALGRTLRHPAVDDDDRRFLDSLA